MGATLRPAHLVMDSVDLDGQATFWTALLDLPAPVGDDDGWRDLGPLGPGGPVLSLQRVPGAKRMKNRLHLDLAVGDFPAAAGRAERLGATPVGGVHGSTRCRWQVWRDPEGNEFCLCEEG